MFPDPRLAPADGPLAIGEDFRPSTLLQAYRTGIFPWPDGPRDVYWWSPDPRAVFPVGTVHRSKSLQRLLRQGRFTITHDTAFADVVSACADRPGQGTWITIPMQAAYTRLHGLGHAHSLEVWEEDRLVGGIYGVAVGAVFTGESMFHRVTNASKVAMVALDDHLAQRGYRVLDVQLHTRHLESMGAQMVSRTTFLDALATLRDAPVTFG